MKKMLSFFVVLFVSCALKAQWVDQTSFVNNDFVSVSAVDNDVCWIAGFGSAVIRTDNGGASWGNVSIPAIGGIFLDISSVYAIDANTCLASLYSTNQTYIYKTTNGGGSWAQVFSQSRTNVDGFNGIEAIYMTSAANGFMVGDPVNGRWSLWKTTDGGSSWDSTGLYLKAENASEISTFHCLYVDASNIWFGTESSRIYYSSDYGQTWSAQDTHSLTEVLDVWFNGTTGIAAGFAGTNFDGPGELYTTTNSGVTWNEAPYPGGINITAVTGKGSNFIYSTLHGAIYLSTNNGASFSKVDSVSVPGHVYYDIRMSRSGNSVWACGPGGRIRKGTIGLPTDGLQLWVRADSGAVLNGSNVSKWTDLSGNGNDAIQADTSRQPLLVSNELNQKPVLRFDGVNDRLGLTGSKLMSQISLFIVEEPVAGATGGVPYYPITFGTSGNNGNNGYGLSMQNQYSDPVNSPDEIDPFISEASWVRAKGTSFSAFGQWKIVSVTTDKNMWSTTLRANGVDASIIPQGTENTAVNVTLGNSTGIGGGGIGALDGAPLGTLIFKGDIAEVLVYDTVLSNSDRLAVEKYLNDKYQVVVTGIKDKNFVPEKFSLEQNYPNPFNPSTTIKYSIAKPGLVKIVVYNSLGQRIKELVNEVKDSGSYSISYNGSTIASGIYFYRIETSQFSQVKKMVVMK